EGGLMKMGGRVLTSQRGFTLIEMVVAAVIFTITTLSLGYFMRNGTLIRAHTVEMDIASRLAENEAERVKAAFNAHTMLADTSYEHTAQGRVFRVERRKVTLDTYTQASAPIYTEASEYAIEIKKSGEDTTLLDFRVLYR
ncbi:MAG: type IV pilus modification PilV family protein, partial [Chitinivibrionales bacterium]